MRLMLAAMFCTLAAPVAFCESTKLLPREVQSAITDGIKVCDEKAKLGKGFLTRRDINGDGVDDFVLDYRHFRCGKSSDFYCGSAGCLTQVFASLPDGTFTKVLDENTHSVRFEMVRGRYTMSLGLHGSSCGKTGAALCGATWYWDGKTFSPAK